MRICICDDEELELKNTKKMVQEYFDRLNTKVTIDCFNDANVLINRLKFFEEETFYDIYFLDIIMQVQGIDIAKQIRKNDSTSTIIFVTTSTEYAIDAFDVRAYDYILKPINSEALTVKLDRLTSELNTKIKSSFIFNAVNHSVVSLNFENVVYIESNNRRIVIHLDTFEEVSSPILRNKFFDSIPFDIDKHNFMICHSSFIVNMNQIKSIEKNYFVMKNNEFVPISKHYYQDVKKKYINYLVGE